MYILRHLHTCAFARHAYTFSVTLQLRWESFEHTRTHINSLPPPLVSLFSLSLSLSLSVSLTYISHKHAYAHTAMQVSFVSLGTVIFLMLFFFVLFGIVGMEAYGGSFSRRSILYIYIYIYIYIYLHTYIHIWYRWNGGIWRVVLTQVYIIYVHIHIHTYV
jgi:hypothetical protein